MLHKTIPSTGEEIPVIGLGTWKAFDAGSSAAKREQLSEVLKDFVAGGGSLVDSSPMYGSAESVVGDLAEEARLQDKLFIATKVWTTGKENGVQQMQESERKLKARIDLMQIHNLVDYQTHLATLREWKAAGRIRYIGITHYAASAHATVAEILRKEPLDFLQINYSAGEWEAELRVLPIAQERGVAVLANRPFVTGDLFPKLRSKPLPEFAAELGCATWSQLLLKFVIAHSAITCVIPATSNVNHLRENMAAGSGPLPDDQLRKKIVAAVESM